MSLKDACILTALFFCSIIYSQDRTLSGTVSFVTSNNVYVKFNSTEDIEIGKVLSFNGNDCLKVTDKSSTSVVCTVLNDCVISNGDTVSYSIVTSAETTQPTTITEPLEEELPPETNIPVDLGEKTSLYKENIRGRVSLSSYNTFSDVRDDRSIFRTRFSLDANHIGDSKVSVQSYLVYRNFNTATDDYEGRTGIFNVYNLNVRYDATPDLSITAGRKINPKASSIGAVDGLQVEKYFGNFYVGGMGGFRPDFENFGFNADLLQYGGYVGIGTNSKDFFSETTLGAMEQTNAGATDRRYIFFQHMSTIASDLTLFSSAELDIFGNNGNSTRLTNLYMSARYRFTRAVNAMISYDSRKAIIYYETFQTDIERLLDDDLARQGLRFRFNVRPTKQLWMGISYSRRFRSDNENKSDNIYGYATLSKIPGIGGRFNVSYNMNSSNYLKSNIYSVRYSREFFKNKFNTDVYFRRAEYTYENNLSDLSLNFYGATLSYRISRTWILSVSGEYSQSDPENSIRFYTRLTKRFYSKKKK
ncbi:hypothetical protein J1N09_12335 [Aureitalea sp. L0-47]|uniref:hypothetical protein n=1 Tax=Aureitalea sp. L0-47 TaxID=2816962 RepID=UPI002237E9A0|nr:hypothetical protein [Aureitalea sp. L0-47]MCW5520633.1 hypothetical protein [Aureitalea sp. L0-47]